MRVAVVGAGLAGLGAARESSLKGHTVTVFEKAADVGGRCKTIERDGFVFDPGLQTFTPRGMTLEKVMLEELPADDLVLVARRVDLYLGGRSVPGSPEKNRVARYTYGSGASKLPKLIAANLDCRLGTPVDEIQRRNGKFVLVGDEFDAVVLTAPFDETARLLATIGDPRSMVNGSYRQCISIALAYDKPAPPVPYYALLAHDRMTPVLWIGIESLKAPNRAPEGTSLFVVQLGPEFSRAHLNSSDAAVLPVAIGALARLFGEAFRTPLWHHVERFAVSQPERVVLFDSLNRPGSKLIIAGDGTLAGRAENAYESGVLAANRLTASVES